MCFSGHDNNCFGNSRFVCCELVYVCCLVCEGNKNTQYTVHEAAVEFMTIIVSVK
jgi:hypothetical protein